MPTSPKPAEPVRRVVLAEQPDLTVAAAARRLGIAPATLRTWDRRYGLGPSEHTPGRHRRYSPADVARLELMQRALVRGASPADAARLATAAPAPVVKAGSVATAGSTASAPSRPGPGPLAEPSVRVDGVSLPLPGAGRRAVGLARAALTLDPVPARALLAESVAAIGVEATWEEVVRPVLRAISERWSYTGSGVEIEHQLTECVAGVLGQYAAPATAPAAARPVMLAGMPGELHALPMIALSATLAGCGVPCRMLGANLPITALVAALRRVAPSVVVLWAEVPETADVAALAELPRTRPRFQTLAAGPGWADRVLPPRVGWLDSLPAARRVITDIVSP